MKNTNTRLGYGTFNILQISKTRNTKLKNSCFGQKAMTLKMPWCRTRASPKKKMLFSSRTKDLMYLWEVSVQSDPSTSPWKLTCYFFPTCLAPQPAGTCFFSPSDKTALHNHFLTASTSYSLSNSTEVDVIKHEEGKRWLLNNQNTSIRKRDPDTPLNTKHLWQSRTSGSNGEWRKGNKQVVLVSENKFMDKKKKKWNILLVTSFVQIPYSTTGIALLFVLLVMV